MKVSLVSVASSAAEWNTSVAAVEHSMGIVSYRSYNTIMQLYFC
jgi:hypothetical protein